MATADIKLLLDACESDDIQTVNNLLQSGVSPNINNGRKFKEIPLHLAVYHDNLEIVELLLKYKADSDVVDEDKNTVLHSAAWKGHDEIVEVLLSHGIDIDRKNAAGNTALHNACFSFHTTIVSTLLSYGADCTVINKRGLTVKQWATNLNKADIVGLLDNFVYDDPAPKSRRIRLLRELSEKMAGEIANIDAEVKQLTTVKADAAAIASLTFEIATLKTEFASVQIQARKITFMEAEIAQLASLKKDIAKLAALRTHVDQLSLLKVDLKAEVKAEREELAALKAEIHSMKDEITKLGRMKAEFDSLRADVNSMKIEFKSRKAELHSINTDLDKQGLLKSQFGENAEIQLTKAEMDKPNSMTVELQLVKTEVDKLTLLKTQVEMLWSIIKTQTDDMASVKALQADFSTMKTKLSLISSKVDEFVSVTPSKLSALEAQIVSRDISSDILEISQRDDICHRLWDISQQLGYSNDDIIDFIKNTDTAKLATNKMLLTWCQNSGYKDDVRKMRELCKILRRLGFEETA